MLIDYPLAPMSNYAGILDWSLRAWRWLGSHGPDAKKCPVHQRPPMFLAGDSSGGGTAFSLLLTLKTEAEGGLMATGYVGESSWLNLNCDTSSYYSQAFSQSETKGVFNLMGDVFYQAKPGANTRQFQSDALYYCGNSCGATGKDLKDPYASPYWANQSLLQKLPPLYFVSSSTETVGGDSVYLARKAAQAGVRVYLDQFAGMWHTFPQWSEGRCAGEGAAPLWQAKLAIQRMSTFIREVASESIKCPSDFKGPGLKASPKTFYRLLSGEGLQHKTRLNVDLCPRVLELQDTFALYFGLIAISSILLTIGILGLVWHCYLRRGTSTDSDKSDGSSGNGYSPVNLP